MPGNLSAFTSLGVFGYPIPERSEATPGLFNQIFSGLSANLDRLNSDVSNIVGSSVGTTESVLGFSSNTLRTESGNTILLPIAGQTFLGRLFPSYTSTYNALWFGSALSSKESRVQNAINQAGADNVGYVVVPQVLLPYSSSSVTFNPNVVMTREGGVNVGVDLQAYGADPTGVLQSGAALVAATNSTGANAIWVSRGTYLCQSATATFANQAVYGEGMGISTLIFRASAQTPNYGAMSIRGNNVSFRDLTFVLDMNSQTAVNALSLDSNCENVTLTNVEISGSTSAAGHRGLLINLSRNTAVYFNRCRFKLLEFALLKPNADTSTQRFFGWANCQFSQCSDAINVNSPLGAFQDISITDNDFERISNFPVAFAGASCNRATVQGNHFSNISIEAVHSEATASDLKILGNDFVNCNTKPGTVGAVNIITGSKNIAIIGNTFDLTQNSTGTALGVSVQPGGGVPCNSIAITGNTFKCTTGTIAAFISTTSNCILSDNVFSNVTSTSQATYFCDVSFSRIHADNNTFFNPKALFNIDDNTETGLSGSRIDGDSATTFSFVTGNTNGSTSVPLNSFAIRQPFVADQLPSFQTLFPAGTLFDGSVGLRFVQNGTTATFVEKASLRWDGTSLTVTSIATNNGASAVVAPTFSDWTVAGGAVQARPAASGSTTTGRISVVFSGIYFP